MGRTNPTIQIPEAKGLTWRDTFFDQESDVIAVFDYDYDAVEKFNGDVATIMMLVPPLCCILPLCCYPCFYKQQIEWDTRSQHVCVTPDGIKHVQDKRKSLCGFDFQDQGKSSKTVPFDAVTDCDVTEPAGATCFCVRNVLPVINVDTASGARGGEDGPKHELSLIGLEKPHELKKLAWAMKRAQQQPQPQTSSQVTSNLGTIPDASAPQVAPQAPTGGTMEDRGDAAAETNAILRDIHKELKDLNKYLRKQSTSDRQLVKKHAAKKKTTTNT